MGIYVSGEDLVIFSGWDVRVSGSIEILSDEIWVAETDGQTESFWELAVLHVDFVGRS